MAKKLTDCAYIVRKLTTSGIGFYGKGKKMARDIIAYLIVHKLEEEVSIPDCPGWYMNSEQKLIFRKEGELTWEIIVGLCK